MKITICGSMTFSKDMLQIKEELESANHTVVVPTNVEKYANGTVTVENKEEKKKFDLIRGYYEEIKKADAILVVNKDKIVNSEEEMNNTTIITNYIGGNTLIEIAFAHVLNKKIFLLNPIPDMSYSDEINAMNPFVINGDLNKIVLNFT